MNRLRNLARYRLRTLFIVTVIVGLLAWWFGTRPRQFARQQTIAGRKLIHERDRTYLNFVFDQTVQDHLVTVIGDSRLTHWNRVRWIRCPDKDSIISYGSDRALLVWNRDDGSIRRGFYDVTTSAYASATGECFLVNAEGKLQVWTMGDEPAVAEQFVLPACDNGRLTCSPCGKLLAYYAVSADVEDVSIWDRESNSRLHSLYLRANAMAFSPDSKSLLLMVSDTIQEYDARSGKLLSQTTLPLVREDTGATAYALVFSDTGEYLFVGDTAGRLLVYAWDEKRMVREITWCPSTISDLSVRTLGKSVQIAIACNNNCVSGTFVPDPSVRNWSLVMLNELTTAVCNGPNGMVAGIRDGRLVEMNGDQPRRMVGGPRVDATCFAFSPSGHQIALAGRDGQIVIRETAKWERVQSWRAHDGWIRRLAWSPRGDLLLSKADDNVLAAWDPRTGVELHSFSQFSTFTFNTISFDGSGKHFAAACGGRGFAVHIIDADTFEAVATIPQSSLHVRGNCILSSDAQRLYAGGTGVHVNVWSVEDGKVVCAAGGTTLDDVKLALSAREDVIFAVGTKTVSAFDVAGGGLLWNVPVHKTLISDISLHPSRPLLATGGKDGRVALVDTAEGKLLKHLRLGPARGDILQVDFSPDGRLLAVAMNNGAVVILRAPWD